MLRCSHRRSSTCERAHSAQLVRTNFDGEIVDDKGRGRSGWGKLLAPGPFCAVAACSSPGYGAVDTTGVGGAPARRDHWGNGASVPTRARLAAGQFSREEDRTEAAKRQRSHGNPCLLTISQWRLDPTQETATLLGGFSFCVSRCRCRLSTFSDRRWRQLAVQTRRSELALRASIAASLAGRVQLHAQELSSAPMLFALYTADKAGWLILVTASAVAPPTQRALAASFAKK
jgi:hypothetical protein